MDFLQTRKYKEWALVGLVGVATLFALLPVEITDQFSINRGYIAAVLGILLVIALFLYLAGRDSSSLFERPRSRPF